MDAMPDERAQGHSIERLKALSTCEVSVQAIRDGRGG